MRSLRQISLAIAVGMGQPLSAMQLLWINLISDIFPGLALALEPPDPAAVANAVFFIAVRFSARVTVDSPNIARQLIAP